MANYSACIDIGGTFTDCVVHEEGGGLRIFKSSSTPGEFEVGFINVLKIAAEAYGLSLAEFLRRTVHIVHGSTVSTNALVEGKVATVGFICNQGHPDILTLREAPRKRAFNWKLDYPEPFVPRNRTFEVAGRIDSLGNEIVPLSESDVLNAADYFDRCGVRSVAVCLLWSIVNGTHELRVRDIYRRRKPDMPITLGHELNPIPREYRRAISTAIDAALQPIVSSYVGQLRNALKDAGFERELLLANCVGGMMPPDAMIARPIYSVMSGPTLAPIAALNLTEERDIVVVDMGGTTFDVSAIRDRQLVITPEAVIGNDLLGLPKVDVHSVGAGGGSIAWVDSGGLLRVGPQSAGARPGPACYGRGGDRATVTDANVVLGIIDPDYFLGGKIKLDRAAAEKAVAVVADALNIGLLNAAYAIHTTSNHNMIAAIEDITVREGIDPRDSYLVAGGGATACHIAEMADVVQMKRYMIPSFAAGLSAFGGLISDIIWEETATLQTDSRRFALPEVNALLKSLKLRGDRFLESAGIEPGRRSYAYVFQGRYEYQSWEIDVQFEVEDSKLRQDDLARLIAAFHQMHERKYTIKDENDVVEFTTWKVRAIGDSGGKRRYGADVPAGIGSPTEKGRRPVYVHAAGGLVDVPVFDGGNLRAGHRIAGPAVIEEETTTILLLPGHLAEMDRHGNYEVSVS